MQKAATTEELQTAIGEHITQAEEHVSRLEQVAAQKIEHYEIAAYGGLVQLAITLDNDEADKTGFFIISNHLK